MTNADFTLYAKNIGKELPKLDFEARKIVGILFDEGGLLYQVEEKWMGAWDTVDYIPVDEVLN